ncbi:MAG: hypothetical protein AB7P00_11305 [Sandaracinaceae bacterium]
MGSGPDLSYAEDAMVERMMELRNTNAPIGEAEAKQFIVGFVNIMLAASQGNREPQEGYLATVVPGLRESGFPLAETAEHMVRVAAAAVLAVEPGHVGWVNVFCADHMLRLVRAWMSA